MFRDEANAFGKVPMDWQNPTQEERVILGVIKLPAKKGLEGKPLFVNYGVRTLKSLVYMLLLTLSYRAQEALVSWACREPPKTSRPLQEMIMLVSNLRVL